MRKNLKNIEEFRGTFIGEFSRYGVKNGYMGIEDTILLTDIKDENGKPMAKHLWFNLTKGFQSLGELKAGDRIQFNARVKAYWKGYKGRRWDVYKPIEKDYKLSHPTKVKLINEEE